MYSDDQLKANSTKFIFARKILFKKSDSNVVSSLRSSCGNRRWSKRYCSLRANVGIAMGLIGTRCCRETADIIPADDNFATIVNAIEQGRHIVATGKYRCCHNKSY